MTEDEMWRQLGFEDAAEAHRLVAAVPLDTSERLRRFKEWQYQDGTKTGILKLMQPPSAGC